MPGRWTYAPVDLQKVAALQKELGIKKSLCEVLVKRGIDTFEDAHRFFRPDYKNLHNPFLMKDMQRAVDRILTAVNSDQKIMIIGDYDVDGTTATAILMRFLHRIHDEKNCAFYIPDRYLEGYGVSKKAVEYAQENEYQLIISLDCGIKANEQIFYAGQAGIDFIVCDHHLPGEELPKAYAILNPKQSGCGYPFKELSGCGVTFKLITALAMQLQIEMETLYCYMDLLMVSIGADIVELRGENRAMAWLGLKHFNESPCIGLKALLDLQQEKKEYLLRDVIFGIAPAINAAGRMSDARIAVELFTVDCTGKAAELARQLWELNISRKEADALITLEAHEIIGKSTEMQQRKSTVIYKEGWHKGVVGIVASRLIETYHRPTIVLSVGESMASGSARSVPGFNISAAIGACAELLISFGGHESAAGLSLHSYNMEVFSKRFEEVVSETIADEDLIPEIRIDAEIDFKEISLKYLDIINQMEPFGPQNFKPVFITRGAKSTRWSKILKEKHLRVVLENEGVMLTGIGFGMANKMEILRESPLIDIVYTLDENKWNGNTSPQLKIVDLRPS